MKRTILIGCLLLLLLNLSVVHALSVSPAKYEVVGKQAQNFDFKVRSDAHQDVLITFEGSLAEYASAPEKITVIPGEATLVTIRVNPGTVQPGFHQLYVVFQTIGVEGQVGSSTQVVPLIKYVIPSPNPYINYTLTIDDWKETTTATLYLNNYGLKQTTVTPTISLDGREQSKKTLPELSVLSLNEEKITFAMTDGPLLAGVYQAKLQLDGPDTDETAMYVVNIGTPRFTVEPTTATGGSPGDVLSLKIPVRTGWNEALEMMVEAKISSAEQTWELTPITTTIDGETELSFFWESEGAEYGVYDLSLTFIHPEFREESTTTVTIAESFVKKNQMKLWIVLMVIVAILLITYQLLFKNK